MATITEDYKEKLKEALNSDNTDYEVVRWIEQNFPELKESEDERIRKRIIHALHGDVLDMEETAKAVVWLEKQGEHANFLNKIQIGDKVTRNEDGVLVNLSQLKRIAKPAEKQGKNNMGISEATKKKLEDSLNEALEKETPESWNEFLDEQELQESDHIDYISGIRVVLLSIEGNAENINCLTESQWVAIRAANRLLGEYIDKEQSRPWSEEDETYLDHIITAIKSYYTDDKGKENPWREELLRWLKSLKERYTWKPSDE